MAQLRQGPSGRPIVGNNVGDTLIWNGAEWEPGQTPDYAAQRDWYIAQGGDDDGPGTESDPLATGAELSRRLSSIIVPDVTTVHYLTDMLPEDYLVGPRGVGPGASFDVIAEDLTVLGEVTITAVTVGDAATRARSAATVAGSPDWGAPFVNKRAEVVTQPGVSVWLDKVDPADNTRSFLSLPVDEPNFTSATLAPGDVLRFTEARRIGQVLSLGSIDVGLGALPLQFSGNVQGVRVCDPDDPAKLYQSAVLLGNSVRAYACDFSSYQLAGLGNSRTLGCLQHYPDDGSGTPGLVLCTGQVGFFWNLIKNHRLWSGPGRADIIACTTTGQRTEFDNAIEYNTQTDPSAYWEWPAGPALEFEITTTFQHRSRAYGTSVAANTYGIAFNTGSMGAITGGGTPSNRPNLIGTLGTGGAGTRDVALGGTSGAANVLYAGLPAVNATNLVRFVTGFGV